MARTPGNARSGGKKRPSSGGKDSLASVLGGLSGAVKGTRVRKPSWVPDVGTYTVDYVSQGFKAMTNKKTGEDYTLFLSEFEICDGDDAGRKFVVFNDSNGIVCQDKETGEDYDFYPGILFIKTLGTFAASAAGEDPEIVEDESELARVLEDGVSNTKLVIEVGRRKGGNGKEYPTYSLKRLA